MFVDLDIFCRFLITGNAVILKCYFEMSCQLRYLSQTRGPKEKSQTTDIICGHIPESVNFLTPLPIGTTGISLAFLWSFQS